MSQKGMKLTGILQNHNQYPEADQKYEPLRKNIIQPNKNIISTQIKGVSYVSRRLQSLSPDQLQVIKNGTFIPVNCGLKVTSNEDKQKRALSRNYVAINLNEKQSLKPITPNTFKQIPKNQKVQVVYQYHCPLAQQNNFQQYNEGLTESKRLGGDRKNYQLKTQEQQLEYSRQNKNKDSNFIKGDTQNRTNIASKGQNSIRITGQNIRTSTSPSNEAVKGSVSNTNQVISYGSTTQGQIIRQNIQSSNHLIRDNSSPNRIRGSQKNIQGSQGNIYTSQHYRTGGYQYCEVANDDNGQVDGPAFFQNDGRSKYNQMGRISRQQYELKSKKQSNTGNIQIGGRSKSNTKHTIQDFQSNIGINSRHNQKNMGSTKDYSRNVGKQDVLDGLQTQVKGQYYVDRQEGNQQEKSRVRDYVQNVESRIVIGNEGRSSEQTGIKNKKKVEMSRQAQQQLKGDQKIDNSKINNGNVRRIGTQYSLASPQIEQRNKKIKQYQNTGTKGYSFKKNEENEAKRKKQEYKYNLYSMCDQQFNLKCATGIFTPNQLCASQPKREGWK